MEKQAFDDYLHNRFNQALSRYKRLESHNEKLHQTIQWCIIILSLLTSVLIGIGQLIDSIFLKVGALVSSVIVASLASVQKTFNYQDRSTHYRKMLADLEREFYLFQAKSGDYSRPNRE